MWVCIPVLCPGAAVSVIYHRRVHPSPARILGVEDDQTVGAGLTAVLAADGHEVGWARSAADARRRLPAADLVLLDLGLPDADGLDLCCEIRDRFPKVVVVVVTARTDEADAVGALDGGADDFVVKPFRPEELLARLRAPPRRRSEAGPPGARG